jgi:hypothetical protein
MLTGILDNILLNGAFAPDLWTRLSAPDEAVECAVWRQTFAADRWKVRYAAPVGGAVTQAMSAEVPAHAAVARSLQIRGAAGVTQRVCFGQRIEAVDATRYRRRMIFSAWLRIEHPDRMPKELDLTFSTAKQPDIFGGPTNDHSVVETCVHVEEAPVGRWWFLEREIDGRGFAPHGLSVEIEFPAELLDTADAKIQIADVRLTDVAAANRAMERPGGLERMLARRFFQKHDGTSLNAIGRALACNPHELHFQFTFPEMRAIPACTLPQDNADLCVFSADGVPQSGFAYDVTFGSRGSVIVRATKFRHQLRDGYLAFRGYRGAILLDAEL